MKQRFGIINSKSIIFIGVAVLVGFLFLFLGDNEKQDNTSDPGMALAAEYKSEIERTASSMCSSINGVDSARVNITLEGGMSYVYAKNSEGSYGGTYFSSGGDPLFLKYDYPKIVGCAVVYSGSLTSDVKLELTKMMSAYLGISSSKIYVGTE